MASDGIGQRFQKGSGFANPIGEGRAVEVEAITVEDLTLTIERQMVGIFADQNMGQQTWAGAAAFDGARGQRGLDEPFAAGAGQPGTDDAVHDEAAWDVFQFLGHIFAYPAQMTAAIGASLGTGAQFDLHPGDVVRDRAALRFILLLDVRQLHPRGHGRRRDLGGLQGQLKLLSCL